MADANRVDISTLSLSQLYDVKRQLQQELDHLGESFQKLKQAQGRFQDCAETVQTVSNPENEEKDMLVPLTSSLYVPGKMKNVETFMVDVGTGYFVEKNAEDSVKFFSHKVQTLTKNLKDLENVVNNKFDNLRVVDETLKHKYQEEQKKSSAAPNASKDT